MKKSSQEAFKEAGVTYHTLSDYESLIKVALDTDYVSEANVEALREWRKDPANWKARS